VCVCVCVCMCIYIYIYILTHVTRAVTANIMFSAIYTPHTKSEDHYHLQYSILCIGSLYNCSPFSSPTINSVFFVWFFPLYLSSTKKNLPVFLSYVVIVQFIYFLCALFLFMFNTFPFIIFLLIFAFPNISNINDHQPHPPAQGTNSPLNFPLNPLNFQS